MDIGHAEEGVEHVEVDIRDGEDGAGYDERKEEHNERKEDHDSKNNTKNIVNKCTDKYYFKISILFGLIYSFIVLCKAERGIPIKNKHTFEYILWIMDITITLTCIIILNNTIKRRNTNITNISSHILKIITGICLVLYNMIFICIYIPKPDLILIDKIILCIRYTLFIIVVLYLLVYMIIHPKEEEKLQRKYLALMLLFRYLTIVSYPVLEPNKYKNMSTSLDSIITTYLYTIRPTAIEFILETLVELLVHTTLSKKSIFDIKTDFSIKSMVLTFLIPLSCFTVYVMDGTTFNTPDFLPSMILSIIMFMSICVLLYLMKTNEATLFEKTQEHLVTRIIFGITGMLSFIGNILILIMTIQEPWYIVITNIITNISSIIQISYLWMHKNTVSRDICIYMSVINFTWWVISSMQEAIGYENYHEHLIWDFVELLQPFIVTSRFATGVMFWSHYKKMSPAEILAIRAAKMQRIIAAKYDELVKVKKENHTSEFRSILIDKIDRMEKELEVIIKMHNKVKIIKNERINKIEIEFMGQTEHEKIIDGNEAIIRAMIVELNNIKSTIPEEGLEGAFNTELGDIEFLYGTGI